MLYEEAKMSKALWDGPSEKPKELELKEREQKVFDKMSRAIVIANKLFKKLDRGVADYYSQEAAIATLAVKIFDEIDAPDNSPKNDQ